MAGPGRPPKRRRISTDQAAEEARITHTAGPRRQHDLRLKSRFDAIFNKYGHDFTGIGDIIDITSGEILVDNGHVSRMRHAGDIGVEVIRTKPVAKPVAKRRKAISNVEDIAERKEILKQEEHDELTSPARPQKEDAVLDEGHTDGQEEAEESMTLPEQQSSTPGASSEPRMAPPAAVATRILQQIVPEGQQVNLNDPAQLALYTQNLVQEILRQTNNAPANPTILPTPPASARSGPLKPFRSVWGGEDAYHSEDDGAEDVDDEEAIETRPLGGATRRARRTWQPDEKAKLLQLRDVDGLPFASIERILDRSKASEKYAALTKGRDRVIEASLTTRRAIESGRRATIASSGIDSIVLGRLKPSEPNTDRPRRRTRQSLPAPAVVVRQAQGTRLRSLRPRKSSDGRSIPQHLAEGLSLLAEKPTPRRKTGSQEAVDMLAEKTTPKLSTDDGEPRRRGPGRPRRQEPQLATDEEYHLKEIPEPTIVEKEQTEGGESRRRGPGRPRKQETQLATDTEGHASGAPIADSEQSNTTSSRPIKSSLDLNRPQFDIQALPPPCARSRLRRVSQRLSLSNPAPTESPVAQAPAIMIDQTTSKPPSEVEILAVQQLPSQSSTLRPYPTSLPQPLPAAKISANAARIAAAASSNAPHKSGSSAQPKQTRVKRTSGGDVRRVSGISSITPRRIVSSTTSATPVMGTGSSSTAVRRQLVREDDLGSDDELDQ